MNVLPYHGREINYHPSHFSPQKPTTSVGPDTTMQSGPVEDKRTRATIEKTNDFGQVWETVVCLWTAGGDDSHLGL